MKLNAHQLTASSLMRPLRSPSIPQPRNLLMPNTPQTPCYAHDTADQRQVVRTGIAVPAIAADHFTGLATFTAIPTVGV